MIIAINKNIIKKEIAIEFLSEKYPGLVCHDAWGETSLFYNPGMRFKRGKYFVTFKEKDGENDASSEINRSEVSFRMNFKINKIRFLELFGEVPKRPAKGGIISLLNYDPKNLNMIMPHPVYGWMCWLSVVNPSNKTFHSLYQDGFFNDAYANAKKLAKV